MNQKSILFTLLLICCMSYNASAQTADELIQKVAKTTDDSKKYKLYSDIGASYFNLGKHKPSITYYFKALSIAEKQNDSYKIAATCNNIACVYNESENYDQALEFVKKGVTFAKKQDNLAVLADLYGTMGISYYQKYEDLKAISYYKKAIYVDSLQNNLNSLAYRYRNIGAAYLEIGSHETGIFYLKKSLAIYKQFSDTNRIFSNLIALSESYSKSGESDSAVVYINQASPFLEKYTNDFTRSDDYYYALYEIYERKGDYFNALKAFKKHDSMNDSIVGIESKAALFELEEKYESDKKDSQIKAQKKKIEQDRKNQLLLFTLLFLSIILFVLSFLFIRYRHKNKLKLEQALKNKLLIEKFIEGEEKERIRIAKDLHDGIVQDLTAIYMQLNQLDSTNVIDKKDKIASYLKQTSHELRNLSHEMMPIVLQQKGLVAALEELFVRTAESSSISFSFDAFKVQENLPKKIEISLYRIVQELINNILKHSQASDVTCILKQDATEITLILEDNGIGFQVTSIKQGIGFESLQSRLTFINGKLEMSSLEDHVQGLYVVIRIPV